MLATKKESMTFMSKMYNYGFASKGELGALVIVSVIPTRTSYLAWRKPTEYCGAAGHNISSSRSFTEGGSLGMVANFVMNVLSLQLSSW